MEEELRTYAVASHQVVLKSSHVDCLYIAVYGLNRLQSASAPNLHEDYLSCCVPLQVLLSLGASPDYKDRRGLTPLYHTVLTGGETSCCETLLYHHAKLGIRDENGWDETHQVRVSTVWGSFRTLKSHWSDFKGGSVDFYQKSGYRFQCFLLFSHS